MLHWIVLTLICLLIVLLLVFISSNIKKRLERKKEKIIFKEAFENDLFSMPKIKYEHVYWWPTFQITFRTAKDFELAKNLGVCKKFEEALEKLYGSPFEARRAVSYYYSEE